MAFLVERCGEMVVSVEPHKPVPAPFLIKTYQLVDDPSTNHIVSWGEDDSTFVVWRPPEFAKDILPNYFKHNNFSSFVRQLNTYGFRKIVAERWEFSNEFFKKGEKHLLSEIHRRKTTQIPQHYHHHHHQQSFHDSPPFQIPNELDNWVEPQMPVIDGGDRTEFLSALSEDNQRLKRRNSLLLSELTHMKKLYTDIIYFIQHHVTPVPPHQRLLADQPPSLSGLHCYKNQDSRIKITEEEPHGDVKLFGVALNGKKLPRMI